MPARTVGLREWTIVLDAPALAALGLADGDVVEDPWGIRVRFVAA
jgi:hypothetical protein